MEYIRWKIEQDRSFPEAQCLVTSPKKEGPLSFGPCKYIMIELECPVKLKIESGS